MARIVIVFALVWALSMLGYLWFNESSWRDKATLLRWVFRGGLTAAITTGILTALIAVF